MSGADQAGRVANEPSVLAGLTTLATIVATVDLERALADLGEPASGVDAVSAIDDPHLGAGVVVVDADLDGWIALAEPRTEGRLTAWLARNGEGIAGRYLAAATGGPEAPGAPDALDAFRSRAAAAGVDTSRVEVGPFGRSVLVLAGSVTGPHLVVAERRTLPSRP